MLINTIDQGAPQDLNVARPLQAVSSAGSAEHGEPAGSPASPTAHWAAQAGGASQRDSDDRDATDGEYVDAAAASVGSPASPTAHWAQPSGAAEQQADDGYVLEEQCIEHRWPSGRDPASETDSDNDNNDDNDDSFDISADYDSIEDPGGTCSCCLQLAV